jgi:hypothetical protein
MMMPQSWFYGRSPGCPAASEILSEGRTTNSGQSSLSEAWIKISRYCRLPQVTQRTGRNKKKRKIYFSRLFLGRECTAPMLARHKEQ